MVQKRHAFQPFWGLLLPAEADGPPMVRRGLAGLAPLCSSCLRRAFCRWSKKVVFNCVESQDDFGFEPISTQYLPILFIDQAAQLSGYTPGTLKRRLSEGCFRNSVANATLTTVDANRQC